MPHPTPTVPIAASPPLHEKGPRGFPLATLVARIMLAVFLFFTMMTVVPWFLTRGPDVAFGVLVSALPTLLILAAFALLLPRGNRIVAAVFGLWCVWGLVGSFSGGPNLLAASIGHALGVLNFVGIMGVVIGWTPKSPK